MKSLSRCLAAADGLTGIEVELQSTTLQIPLPGLTIGASPTGGKSMSLMSTASIKNSKAR